MSPPRLPAIGSGWDVLRAVLRPAPAALTLEQLRSDLSHETAAKLARLAGLVLEWRRGGFRPTDPADAEAILADLERIHLRHARLAAGSFATFARLTRLLGTLRRGRARLRSVATPDAARCAEGLDELRRDSQALCEALSARHGIRFADLVGAAVEEVRNEAGDVEAGGVAVVLEGATETSRAWVPRADAGMWADVVRNLVRNAVQAAEAARSRPGGEASGAAAPRRVTVRLQPSRGRPGTTLEVLDGGVGMSPAMAAAMWEEGRSRRGGQHGQGLTEAKRAFVEARAALEVRSVEGVGTCVRLDLAHRDVPVRPPRPWALPPVVLPALVVVGLAALGGSVFLQPEIMDVQIASSTIVRALDARDRVVWQRDLHEEVLPNFLGTTFTTAYELKALDRFVVLPARWPWPCNVIVATRPPQGPGHVWRLGLGGRTVWKRTLTWDPPRSAHTGSLKSVFQVMVPWAGAGRPAIVMNVRDADWGATALQFISPDGAPLGAYHHPGHLDYRAVTDLDHDGRAELVLTGRNNRAPEDSTIYRVPPGEEWVECILMLEPPRVDGQSYPYTGWAGMPRAREEGYLLIPPLRRGPTPDRERPSIRMVDFGAAAPGRADIEVRMADGRVYSLDSRLRPLSCGTGSETYAGTLAPTRALAPLLYFHDGRCDTLDLPVQRGS